MKKIITATAIFALSISSIALANTPTYKDCPEVNKIQKQTLSPGGIYYHFIAQNDSGVPFKSYCEQSQECGPNGSYRYSYDYKNAILNQELTHYVPVSQTLTCTYDVKNQNNNMVHIQLFAHNIS